MSLNTGSMKGSTISQKQHNMLMRKVSILFIIFGAKRDLLDYPTIFIYFFNHIQTLSHF